MPRILACLLLALATLPAAVPSILWDSGDPTGDEQYVLELINRARANPDAEADRLDIPNSTTPDITDEIFPAVGAVSPSPPLAMNRLLLQAARAHSQDMWTRSFFSHTNPSGIVAGVRIANTGYVATSYGENIAASSNASAGSLEDALMIDSSTIGRGHRQNLLNVGISYREVGIGYYHNATANVSGYRSFLTQDFGTSATGPFLVGVVYADANANGFYDAGEGMPGVLVTPSSGTYGALTGAAGGYAFPVASSGSIDVTFSGGGLAGTVLKAGIALGSGNRKVDARASEAVSGGGSAPATPVVAASVANPTSTTPTLSGTTEANAIVTIYDGSRAIGVTTANGAGAWSWTATPPLATGTHTLTWRASNGAGSSGTAPTVDVSVGGGSSGGGGGAAAGGGSCGAGGATAGLLLLALGLSLRPRRRRTSAP